MLPKIDPLPGIIVGEWKRCGKPSCRCAEGRPHGPYFARRWRQDGRQRRQYVKATDAEQVRARLAAWRDQHPPARSTRDELAELRRLIRSLED
jgi:hypothetical protein